MHGFTTYDETKQIIKMLNSCVSLLLTHVNYTIHNVQFRVHEVIHISNEGELLIGNFKKNESIKMETNIKMFACSRINQI